MQFCNFFFYAQKWLVGVIEGRVGNFKKFRLLQRACCCRQILNGTLILF